MHLPRERAPLVLAGALLAPTSLAFALLPSACSHADGTPSDLEAPRATLPGDAKVRESAVRMAPAAELPDWPQLDGRAFPDHVLALTWDDGPDRHTLDLADYLASEHVSATFFVVGEWRADKSSDPGVGQGLYETGAAHIPILPELVALGHRLGNHTENHALLWNVSPGVVEQQIADNDRRLAPLLTNELRLFRVPGGAWSRGAAKAVRAAPELVGLTGPVRWDIDRKDWETAIECDSRRPSVECEKGPAGTQRVKASVTARRYLASIESARRGVVLFHDRVGDVGSRYATDLAEALIPELSLRGYVFAAPVLAFSPLTPRESSPYELLTGFEVGSLRVGDVDGDGRADACGRLPSGFSCFGGERTRGTGLTRVSFSGRRAVPAVPTPSLSPSHQRSAFDLADVDGDGKADACAREAEGIVCALSIGELRFGEPRLWSLSHSVGWEDVVDFSDSEGWATDPSYERTLRFADIDGDKLADVCGRTPSGVMCAKSRGGGFDHARLWLPALSDAAGWLSPRATTMQLADINGDGRSDLCVLGEGGLLCALSNGRGFGRSEHPRERGSEIQLERWSKDFDDVREGTLRFGDLNGDGRADVCGIVRGDLLCALSNGKAFLGASVWLRSPPPIDTITLADVSADGRADLSGLSNGTVVAALAP